MTNGSLMKVKSIAECCNTFDLHKAIIGLENQFPVFLRVLQVLTYSDFQFNYVIHEEQYYLVRFFLVVVELHASR